MPIFPAGNRTLVDLIEERAEAHPQKEAFVFEDAAGEIRRFTYLEFLEAVESAAGGLAGLGVGPGSTVNVHLRNCPEFMVTWFALARLGAAMVPSNIANQVTEMEHVLTHSESIVVVTEPMFLELFSKVLPRAPNVSHLVVARTDVAAGGAVLFDELLATEAETVQQRLDGIRPEPLSLVEMLYTSGTTAKPKAVMLTHSNHLHCGRSLAHATAMTDQDRCLSVLPLFHVNSQARMLGTLTVGATSIILEEYAASRYLEQARSHGATDTVVLGMQARTLLAQPPSELDREHGMRRLIFAINIRDDEKEEFERRFGVELLNCYGGSESMTPITFTPTFGPQRWPSIGLPFTGPVKILREDGSEADVGEVGEIFVQGTPGHTLMKGYYKDPEATRKALSEDGWLTLGDGGFVDDKGYIYFFDRKKDMIKRAGENIAAIEVEAVLMQHEKIAEAAVVGVPDTIRDEAVKAFIVPTEPGGVSEEEVLAHARENLAHFKVPTVVEFRESLPKTSVGKIEKKLLREDVP